LIDENKFSEAIINDGFKNEDFRLLIIWLSNEISELGRLEEKVNNQRKFIHKKKINKVL